MLGDEDLDLGADGAGNGREGECQQRRKQDLDLHHPAPFASDVLGDITR